MNGPDAVREAVQSAVTSAAPSSIGAGGLPAVRRRGTRRRWRDAGGTAVALLVAVAVAAIGVTGRTEVDPPASDPSWPECDTFGPVPYVRWPGVGELVYHPSEDDDPSALVENALDLAAVLAPSATALGAEAVGDECQIRLGDAGTRVTVSGNAEDGYSLAGVYLPKNRASQDQSFGYRADGARIEVNLPDGFCGSAPCSTTVAVRYGDAESSAVADPDGHVEMEIRRGPLDPGTVVITAAGDDGEVRAVQATIVPPGDFAAG